MKALSDCETTVKELINAQDKNLKQFYSSAYKGCCEDVIAKLKEAKYYPVPQAYRARYFVDYDAKTDKNKNDYWKPVKGYDKSSQGAQKEIRLI